MGVRTSRSIHPEITLTDQFLRHIPRSGKISKADLLAAVYRENPEGYIANRDYLNITLEILQAEKYIEVIKDRDDNIADTEYRLTIEGRALQDAGGYLKKYKERIAKEAFDKKVSSAEGKKKIFDNKVKYFVFFIVVLTAIIGLWPKHSSNVDIRETETHNLSKKDSFAQNLKDLSSTETALTTSEKKKQQNRPNRVGQDKKKTDSTSIPTSFKPGAPIQTAVSDNIEFKLIKVTGNSKAQSVTCTLILTTSAANWYIMSSVKSIIDVEGNEYKLKSFTNGASTYSSRIDLTTDVPIKCTYTFGGILPDVSTIKLFKYNYNHSAGEPFSVEFREIAIDWK